MSTMLEYFEQALKLKEGKKIIIAVRDKNELRSKKCGINNIKRAYSKNTGGSDDMVEVYGLEDGNQLFLVIEKLSAREDKAFIMNPDGSIEPLVIERRISPELQRTIEEMNKEPTIKEELEMRLKEERKGGRVDDRDIYVPENDDLDEFKQAMQDIHRNVNV